MVATLTEYERLNLAARARREGLGLGVHLAGGGAHRGAAAAALSRDDRAAEPRGLPALPKAHRLFHHGRRHLLPGVRDRLAARRECPRASGSLAGALRSVWSNVRQSFAVQWRVVGALLIREIYTRFGREGLGFAWIVLEPLIFAIPVLLVWSAVRDPTSTACALMPFLWSGYLADLAVPPYRRSHGYCSYGSMPACFTTGR